VNSLHFFLAIVLVIALSVGLVLWASQVMARTEDDLLESLGWHPLPGHWWRFSFVSSLPYQGLS
jgi:hypothetical protein